MPRTIEFQQESRYTRSVANRSVVWEPKINATFRTEGGRTLRGRALVDSGSPWCAIPKEVATGWFGIDIDSCPVQTMRGIAGLVDIPYTDMLVRAFDLEVECKVLLLESELHLVGRLPFFSMVELGFHEEANGTNSRVLYSKK